MKNKKLYPENGSVVIVDDQIEETLPLMVALSKLDISYKYFSGKSDDLPTEPLSNIKIIFLDIQLEGMEGVQNDKTKLSTLANVISKIVGNSCIPYIIIAWTKNKELVSHLNNYLNNNKPLLVLTITKDEVKKNAEFDIEEIRKKLEAEIRESSSFQFFLSWQNIVNLSSIKVVNEIASIYSFTNKWDNKIQNILKLLAEAYAGKQAGNDMVRNAMMCFNNLYLDIIENNILSGISDFHIDNQEMNNLNDDEIKGELNRRLLISLEKSNSVVPGNIYEENYCFEFIKLNPQDIFQKIDVEEFKKKLKECLKQFESDDCREEIKNVLKTLKKQIVESCCNSKLEYEESKFSLVFLEVSPFCDYAQEKWRMHRILPGIAWPSEYKGTIKKADYIYKTPLFRIDNKLLFYVFDIRYLTSLPLGTLNDVNSNLRFRKELLNDIQTKIAAHINRPGITSV